MIWHRNYLRQSVVGALFAAVLATGCSVVLAQPVHTTIPSVEWIALRSPLIVHGVVESSEPIQLQGGTFHPRSSHVVTLRVLDTIKGEHADRVQFVNYEYGQLRFSSLVDSQHEVLVFLEPWMLSDRFRQQARGYVYTRFPYVVDLAILTTEDHVHWMHNQVPVLARDFTQLITPQEVVDAIRNYLARDSDRWVYGDSIDLPRHLSAVHLWTSLIIPVEVAPDRSPPPDFEAFKERFCQPTPVEPAPRYTRDRGGYIGVYALELMALDCDAIVRGVIEDSCFVRRTTGRTGDAYAVKLRVLESIKGEAGERITCYVHDVPNLEELKSSQRQLILFMRTTGDKGYHAPMNRLEYYTRDDIWDNSVIVLDDQHAEVLMADLTWHSDPETILGRLREVAGRTIELGETRRRVLEPQRNLPISSIHPPASVAAGSSIEGNPYAQLHLPVDEELQANARRWAASEDRDLRWAGARALVYFKSDENAEILRRLLDDQATWDRRTMLRMTRLSYPHQPDYLVRWEAWHVLAGWGYEVPQVAFEMGQ